MFFRLTPVVKALLIANVAIYVLFNLLLSAVVIAGVPLDYWMLKLFALQPIDGIHYGPGFDGIFLPWQLLTYQFMHGGFGHLFFNMFSLWMFSSELEEQWGSAKFLVYYLLAGIGAGLLYMLIGVASHSGMPMIGASGAIYGVLLGFALVNPDRRIMMFPIFIPIRAKWFGIGLMVLELLYGVLGTNDGVAHFAHLGGAITGWLLVKFGERTPIFKFARKYIKFGLQSQELLGRGSWDYEHGRKLKNQKINTFTWGRADTTKQQQYTPPSQTTNYTYTSPSTRQYVVDGHTISQETVDALLDKISQSGYSSLSEQEKYILAEISKQM
jgi:membrane associated rhomboid family serine protease